MVVCKSSSWCSLEATHFYLIYLFNLFTFLLIHLFIYYLFIIHLFISVRNAFYKIVKAKPQRASRLHSCESIFIIFLKNFLQSSHPLLLILRAKTALNVAICMILFNIFLDNAVMNTPKRRILSLVFTVLYLFIYFNCAYFKLSFCLQVRIVVKLRITIIWAISYDVSNRLMLHLWL